MQERLDLLVGDDERYQASEILSSHYAQGRITAEEFNERLSDAMGARTRLDLEMSLARLPVVVSPPRLVSAPPSNNGLVIVEAAMVLISIAAVICFLLMTIFLLGTETSAAVTGMLGALAGSVVAGTSTYLVMKAHRPRYELPRGRQ